MMPRLVFLSNGFSRFLGGKLQYQQYGGRHGKDGGKNAQLPKDAAQIAQNQRAQRFGPQGEIIQPQQGIERCGTQQADQRAGNKGVGHTAQPQTGTACQTYR